METTAAEASERRYDRGQHYALVIALAGLATGVSAIYFTNGAYAAYIFATITAAVSIGGPAVARIFIERRREQMQVERTPQDEKPEPQDV